MSTIQPNASDFTLTLNFNKKSRNELKEIIKELINFGVPFNKIIVYNRDENKTKVHIMVSNHETLKTIIENRKNLNYYTTSRDYHVLTGSISSLLPTDLVAKLIQHGLKFDFYHSFATPFYHSIFGLIKHHEDWTFTNVKHKHDGVYVTLKTASNAKIKTKSTYTNTQTTQQIQESIPELVKSNLQQISESIIDQNPGKDQKENQISKI